MAKEIERKFLVSNDSYKAMAEGCTHIVQAYLSTTIDSTVRLRIADDKAYITVKSRNKGCSRGEWEYEIPVSDASEMISACHLSKVIDKIRYYVEYKGHTWEVDEFAGKLNGLVIAEIELPEENSPFELPPFAGEEVTGQSQYYNSNLINLEYPF